MKFLCIVLVIVLMILQVVFFRELALCPAPLLPELQPAPCFLSAIIGQID